MYIECSKYHRRSIKKNAHLSTCTYYLTLIYLLRIYFFFKCLFIYFFGILYLLPFMYMYLLCMYLYIEYIVYIISIYVQLSIILRKTGQKTTGTCSCIKK